MLRRRRAPTTFAPLATVWATYLDQDGAEPREAVAMRKRGFTLGVCRDGLVPLRGNLLAGGRGAVAARVRQHPESQGRWRCGGSGVP